MTHRTGLLSAMLILCCLLFSGFLGQAKAIDGVTITPYGFVRFDLSHDDSQLPAGDWDLYVKPEGHAAHEQEQLSMTARHTRFGLKFKDERVAALAIKGVIEVDFAGGFASSSSAARQPLLRLRHAWIEAGKGNSSMRFGQDWALISGPFPATTSFVVGAGKGNLWMRFPQVCYRWKKDNLRLAVSLNRPMAAETKHDDAAAGSFDPISEGELTGMPWWMGRIWWKQGNLQLSASGHIGTEQISSDFDADTWSANADFIWTGRPFSFTMRAFTGANLNSFFGGVFQGVSGDEEVESQGGWGQVIWAPKGPWSVAVGGGMDDPDDEVLSAGARAKNTWMFTTINRKAGTLTHSLGIDLLTTAYTNAGDGVAIGDGENVRLSYRTVWKF